MVDNKMIGNIKKKIKHGKLEKEVKLSLFPDNIILCVESMYKTL